MTRLNERGEMPREQINHPDLNYKAFQQGLRDRSPDDIPKSEWEPWNESSLHVGWQSSDAGTDRHGIGWVQIGLEFDVEYARFALATPNGVTDDRSTMWTPPMSPAEIDRLIETLRRARRKAFRNTAEEHN